MKQLLYYLTGIIVLFLLPFTWEFPLPIFRNISLGLLFLGGLVWLVLRWRIERPFYFPRAMLPVLAFLGLQALSLLITPLPIYGLYWFLFGLFSIIVFIFVHDTTWGDWKPRTWENSILTIGFLFAIIGFLRAISWYRSWWEISGSVFAIPPTSLRLSGLLLGHPNLLAAYMNLVIPLSFVRLLRATKKPWRILWAIMLLTFFIIMFFSGSRGGWLGLIGAFIVMLALHYIPMLRSQTYFPKRSALKNLFRKGWIWMGIAFLVLVIVLAPLIVRQVLTSRHGTFGDRWSTWISSANFIAAAPLTGQGLGSIPIQFATNNEAFGITNIYHTHNLLMQIWAETGIFGLLLVLLALIFTLRTWMITWRELEPGSPQRYSLIAFAGVTNALLIHGVVDVMLRRILMVVGFIAILALFYRRAPTREHFGLKKKYAVPLLALMIAISLFGKLYFFSGLDSYLSGIEAAIQGEWVDARDSICLAADKSPQSTLYRFQCALANAYVSHLHQDERALHEAISNQREALEIDPYWYIHWANLATYEWQAGEFDQAIIHMNKAVNMAPNDDLIRLNLGWMNEQFGKEEQALEAYQIADCMNPWIMETPFFTQSELRKNVLRENCPPDFDYFAKKNSNRDLWNGWQALEADDLDDAEFNFKEALRSDIHNSFLYAALGLVQQKKGLEVKANQSIDSALFVMDKADPSTLVIAASVELMQGKEDQAMQSLAKAFEIARRPFLSQFYYPQAYRSYALPTDLSPFIVTAGLTDERKQNYLRLAGYYHQQGEFEKEREVLEWIDRN